MFDQTQSQILDGLMIGDGYIPRNQDLFYFGQRRASREYVEFVARQLGVAVERVKDRTRQPDRRTGKAYECSELRTLSHPVFADFRNRWYGDGRKVVPRDISISREFLLHWFLCDGACSVNRRGAHLMLCTDAFSRDEVEYLQARLASVGIESAIMRSNRLRVNQRSIERFYEFIGECPVECLKYKWIPVANRTSKQQNLKPFYEQIFNLYTINGWSCNRIARKFETNYYSIRYVLKNHYGIRFGKNPTAETTCREGVVAPSETTRRASAARMKT
jgi:LAGLIDADG DNA endonuclease family